MKLERIPWDERGTPTESELRRQLEAEGFDALVWRDPPHRAYEPHSHARDESLWVVRGAIVFTIAGAVYPLGPGDRLLLPRGTVHAARAGDEGATYLIGERG